MHRKRFFKPTLTVLVFVITIFLFLTSNGVFDGEFDNDTLGWLFLIVGTVGALLIFLFIRSVEYLEDLYESNVALLEKMDDLIQIQGQTSQHQTKDA